ncbi:MAG: hypothetical protein ACWA41_12775 [Putridiphycobacter sp.]
MFKSPIDYICVTASLITIFNFIEGRANLPLKIASLKQRLKSESFKKQVQPFSEFIQFGLLISVICFVLVQIGLAMLTGTSAMLSGIPLNYVFVVKGLSVLCTFVGSFFLLRLIHLGEDSIFKKYFKF